jgi:hypothetical protein
VSKVILSLAAVFIELIIQLNENLFIIKVKEGESPNSILSSVKLIS